jgi:5-methylcytosine-specific restriction endonuclease McrA
VAKTKTETQRAAWREASKRYREKNPDYGKQWYAANREREREKNRLHMKRQYAENPAQHREASKRWRAANPDKVREQDRRRRTVNADRACEKKKRSCERNRAKRLESMRRYYIAHREKLDRQNRQYRREHPEKLQGGFRCRAATYGVVYEQGITWRAVLARDGTRCALCGSAVIPSGHKADPLSATVDHKVPMSKGGGHTWENVQLAHRRCNVRRWTMDLKEWHATRGNG